MRQSREETNKRFEEQTKVIAKLGINIRTVGARWEIEAEVTIRNTLKELLLKRLNVVGVSEWKVKDKE